MWEDPSPTDEPRYQAIGQYLSEVMSDLAGPLSNGSGPIGDVERTAQHVFDVLTSREFCYLSKSRVEPYRTSVLEIVRGAVRAGSAIPFYYDLGAGYHATVSPGELGLDFRVGLAELLVLRQIRRFRDRVRAFYPPAVRFTLVIDNLAGLLINDVPLEKTMGYCHRLRALVESLDLQGIVDLLVESEHYTLPDFEAHGVSTGQDHAPSVSGTVSEAQRANVERFLGRPVDGDEAHSRVQRHDEVIQVSDQLLERLIDGVHMTQRATDTTICFRAFPGGDSRVQVGVVGLTRNVGGVLRPILLTSKTIDRFSVRQYQYPRLLPPMIEDIFFAERNGSANAGQTKHQAEQQRRDPRRGGHADAATARCAPHHR